MWKFDVRNLGAVGHAEIDMAPLVLLVGQNNTGKSYVATLAWALCNLNSLFAREELRNRRPEWFEDFVKKGVKDKGLNLRIEEAEANELTRFVNDALRNFGGQFLGSVFAFEGFETTTVQISPNSPFEPFEAFLSKIEAAESKKDQPTTLNFQIVENGEDKSTNIRFIWRPEISDGFKNRIFTEFVYRVVFGRNGTRQSNALYIPAGRTGLMLAFRALVARQFEDDSATTILPRPIATFLQKLTLLGGRQRPLAQLTEVAEWFRREVIRGQIVATGDQIPSFAYTPDSAGVAVPLHAASSLVSELAPFLLLLSGPMNTLQIVFEEPEAHLHLSAQRSMARALARLLNAGIRVLVTTHSDTFVQQINNLMQLYSHPQREQMMKRLGYVESDVINPTAAIAYEFTRGENGTVIEKLQRTPEGFVVPSLNETLIGLAQETVALQEDAK